MKTYKNKLALALIVSLVAPATAFVAVPQAEASCSYQGYISSHGKCDKSNDSDDDYEWYYWDDSDDWDDEDDDWYYDDRKKFLKNNRSNNNHYLNNNYSSQINQLLVLIAQLQALLEAQQGDFDDNSNFNVTTQRATDVDDSSAKLRGYVDIGDADDVSIWFEYGENRNQLNYTTSNLANSNSRSVYMEVDNLDEDSQYYFRIVGRDEDNDIDRGSIMSFRTDDDSYDDDDEDLIRPDVETGDADDVTDNSARLQGSVDMNDFDNGHSFFVYGEDEDLVSDIEDEYNSFSDIDEEGDNLRKIWGSSGSEVSMTVYNLDDNTTHYFSLCVEYEDEHGDDTIVCGDVEEFETDEN